MTYSIPVLFVFFNRLEIAKRSFEYIRAIRPAKLYLACDGPRDDRENEAEVVDMTRKSILNSIDWECDVKTLFQEHNLGCRRGVATAIDWLFENEEYGIILEDDCMASRSFFLFMEEMLLRFRDDQRIGMIAGSNLIAGYVEQRYSYLFSRYKSCWGWGTWRRAWRNMDMEMVWRTDHLIDIVSNSGYYGRGRRKWLYQLKCMDAGYVSAWDWPWYFSLAAQNQLCIYPNVNLVSNIGNDAEATHTSFTNITVGFGEMQFPIVHPRYICPNEEFDMAFWKSEHSLSARLKMLLPLKVKSCVKRILFKK